MYMTSTLEACFKPAENTARKELADRTKPSESEEADQHVGKEPEQQIKFYDELASDKFAKEAPAIMHSFQTHGDVCTQLESEALQIASRDLSDINLDEYEDHPMEPYNDILERLEALQTQASDLETAIFRLTESTSLLSETSHANSEDTNSNSNSEPSPEPEPPSNPTSPATEPPASTQEESAAARSQLISIFNTCLPILRARKVNIGMAQQLVEGAKEMLGMTLHLESLGLSEGEEDYDGSSDEEAGLSGQEKEDGDKDTRIRPGGDSDDD
ncbi:hypothetical protein VKT23_001569 [Stygiomarasmius scandens]